MVNNKYLDKVLEHMVRNTKLDHNSGEIITPFALPPHTLPPSLTLTSHSQSPSFSAYCKKHFGLIDDEVKYVYRRYVRDYIYNGNIYMYGK